MGHLAGVLRSLRDDAAITQEELADRAGLSARTVSDIERGLRRRLYRDTAERLGAALGLTEARLEEFVELARGRATDLRRELDTEFRRRFVAWHVDRVSALAGHVGSEEQWYAVLDADGPNLTVALRWAEESGDTEVFLQLCVGLWRYWQARGDLAGGRAWLERGLAGVPPATVGTRTDALWGLAWLSLQQGDDSTAARCAAELAGLADEAGTPAVRRNAATVAGMVALARDEVGAATERLDTALALARELDQPWLLATSLLNVGIVRIAARDTAGAREVLGEALREYAEVGDERFRARTLGYLGLAAVVDGDPARAEALYLQSLVTFDELAEPKGIAEAVVGLATAAALRGDPVRAAQLAGAAERTWESFGGRPLPVELRVAEAVLARARESADDQVWHEAWIRGRALRQDEAIALAQDLPG
ncbi:MAG TPA: helix-turn-helix transcriptional regulator [Nocardioides sp.]|nr:helix-turn-helix transcriptional regulator [Nocardioides sp.]